jgi:UDP-N-acetylmuramyl pentapeptide phosphotransferase/UDP-N-acetylglucosamine-1-phosphate transferase
MGVDVVTWPDVFRPGGMMILSAIVSAGLIVILRPLLARYAMARPNARSSHKIPTPQGGGIAVLAATLLTTALILFVCPGFGRDAITMFGLVAAASVVLAILGAIDDIFPLEALPRLAVQFLAAAIVVASLPADLQIIPVIPLWTERLLLVLAGVWFVNLVNFMDGIDWMTVAEVVPVTAGLALLAMFDALPPLAMAIALALLGAMIGFAPFNRPVAKLFLGDVGSLPIGLLLFWLLLQLAIRGHLAAALLLPLYYIADTTIVLLRRTLNGEPITQAHRSHFYQRATERGFTVMDVVLRVFAINVTLVVLAAITVRAPSLITDLGALALGAAFVAWLLATFARGARR